MTRADGRPGSAATQGRRARWLILAGLLAALAGQPRAQIVCADCDGDTVITILDSLRTAQSAAGLLTIRAGDEILACDCDTDATITILDALCIARVVAALDPAPTSCPGQIMLGSQLGVPTAGPVADLLVAPMDPGPAPDVVTLEASIGVMGIHPGPTFATRFPVPIPMFATALVGGDVDGDQDIDVALARSTGGGIEILLNDGTGQSFTGTQIAAGQSYADVVALDLNGDLDLDLAAANQVTGAVDLFENTGGGTFLPGSSVPTGLTGVAALVGGDFDGDQDIDVALVSSTSGLVGVLENNGLGSLILINTIPVGASPGQISTAQLDLGRLTDQGTDLIVGSTATATVQVLVNTGNLTFAPPQPALLAGQVPAVGGGMVDRDLLGDFAAGAVGQGEVALVAGSSSSGDILRGPMFFETALTSPGRMTVADVGGGDRAEIVVADAAVPGFSVLAVDGIIGFEGKSPEPTLVPRVAFADRGDVDGMGGVDMVLSPGSGSVVEVVQNDGNGNLTSSVVPVGMTPRAVRLADFDGDTILDLAVGYLGIARAPEVYLGNGAGGFASPRTAAGFAVLDPQLVAPIQTDADPAPELLTSGNSQTAILDNDGAGNFTVGQTWAIAAGTGGIQVLDANSDTHLDFLLVEATAGSGSGTMRLFLNDGVGGFPVTPITIGVTGSEGGALASADVDGNGFPDLLVGGRTSAVIELFLNQNGSTFAPPIVFSAGALDVAAVTLQDLDDDGDADVLAAVASSGDLVVFPSSRGPSPAPVSRATFGIRARLPVAVAQVQSMVVVDLDGDGVAEIVLPSATTPELYPTEQSF